MGKFVTGVGSVGYPTHLTYLHTDTDIDTHTHTHPAVTDAGSLIPHG